MTEPRDVLLEQIGAVIDTYTAAECTLAVAGQQVADNQTLAAARAADQAQIGQLQQQQQADAATIADLKAQIAALTPAPVRKPLLVGAHVAGGTTFTQAQNLLGPIPATRVFHPGALPTTFAADAKNYPPGTILVVSYKTPQTNLAAYVKSAPPGLLRMCFHHEPENEFGGVGADFVKAFVKEYATSKAAAPDVPFVMAAMTYQYASGRYGANGSFLPPPESCDAYYADDYEGSGGPPLANNPEFLAWYNLVKDRGRPLGFAEYGRGNAPADTKRAATRAATMAADVDWIKAHPAFELLLYWYSTGSGGQDWRFTDAASVAAWKQMVATLAA